MIGFVRDTLRVLAMPCREHTGLLSRELDAPLSRGERFGLRIHLLYCRGCYRFRRQIRLLRELADSVGRELESRPGLPADARQRILGQIGDTPDKS